MDEARIGPAEDAAIVGALPVVVPEIAPDAGVVSLTLAAAIDHAVDRLRMLTPIGVQG